MMDSGNSTTFIKRPPCMTDKQERFLYTKELLTERIFSGYYQERRYVSALKEYRDVVIINSEETDLQNDIDKLRQRWLSVKSIKWVGITGPDAVDLPNAYCFWVQLTNLAFGYYWFQIKCVKLVDEEILLHLKCIRKFQTVSRHLAQDAHVDEKSSLPHRNEKNEPSTSLLTSFKEIGWEFPKKAFAAFARKCDYAMHTAAPHLTWENLLTFVKVAWALTIALFLGTVTFVGDLGEYILKLIRELSLLVHAFTPIIIHLIDFFSKIFGGLFILIAGLFGRNVYRLSGNMYGTNVVQTPVDWRTRNQMLRKELLSNEFRR